MSEVLLAITHTLPCYKVERILGVVYGSSVRTRGLGGEIIAGIEAIVGGRGEAYSRELEKARDEAIEELVDRAKRIGANAVIGVDFETTEILEGFIDITAYGTAVVARPME